MSENRRGAEAFLMQAAVVRKPHGGIRFEEVLIAPPRPDEILIRNVATGICHTDINGLEGRLPSPLPIVLGHEGSGVVEAVGAEVHDVAPGDHVVMTYLTCGTCRECTSGHESSCRSAGRLCFSGARPDGSHALQGSDGGVLNDRFFGQSSFAQYSIAHRNNVIKVSKDLPLALLGPLGCGIMTGAGASWNILQVQSGMSFAVFGSGAVGLSALMAARIAGASTIIAIDRVPERLELAQSLGATHVVDAGCGDLVEAVSVIAPDGIDRTIDTTGRLAVMENAVRVLAQRGIAALVSHAEADGLTLSVKDMILGSKSVCGVAEGGGSAAGNINRILSHFASGDFPFDRLIKAYPYEQIQAAIDDSLSGAVIKPVICWG